MSSSKQLTAKIKFNTTDAEKKIDNLVKKINGIDNALKKVSGSNKVEQQLKKSDTQVKSIKDKVMQWAKAQQQVTTSTKATNTVLGSIGSKLKMLASTYLGIMGAKVAIGASDTITSARNRLNNLEGGSPEATTEAMDKMYVAAQKSRSAYGDMLTNVSKTITLAGGAFNNNIDNAIRFQEIMAKAYSVGGATDSEKSSSMYQLVQALGSGVLQGDELRSVREGAPIAYKEIEKFAQGVLNTNESLKELASQGKITSDMVVAAIMNAGDQIDAKFENTAMTFGQAWDMIKNMALQAFRPVLDMLNKTLNSDLGKKIINGIGYAFVWLANTMLWVGNIIGKVCSWIADNWDWLKYVVIFAVVMIIGYLAHMTIIAVGQAMLRIGLWILENWHMLLILITIAALVTGIIWLANTTADGCEFMIKALILVALAVALIGVIMGNMTLVIIALVILLVAVFLRFAQEIIGGAFWLGAAIVNVFKWIGNVFMGVCNWLGALWDNTIAAIVNVAMGLWNVIVAVTKNIGIAFQNGWIHAQNGFWSFVQNVLEGIKWLEPAINAIAQAFGKEGFTLTGLIEDVSNKQKATKSYNSISDAWNSGMSSKAYTSFSDAWSNGMNTFDYLSLSDAYDKGAAIGANIQDTVGGWGSAIKDTITGLDFGKLTGGLDTGIGDKTGSYLPGLTDPAYNLDLTPTNDYLKGIDADVGDIKDSMDLSNDDLEYLRKIADMEWRNEFTTAEIRVDMTNNNTVSSERDLDGIVEYLSDVLRNEMTNVAYGVHY